MLLTVLGCARGGALTGARRESRQCALEMEDERETSWPDASTHRFISEQAPPDPETPGAYAPSLPTWFFVKIPVNSYNLRYIRSSLL